MAAPVFWSESHTAECRRIRYLKALYEGRHEIVLFNREGWSLPIFITLNWLGDRLTNTVRTLVWRRPPQVKAGQSSDQVRLDQLIADLRFHQKAPEAQTGTSYAGYSSLKLCKSLRSQRPYLKQWGDVPGESAHWEFDGDDPWAVTFYRDEIVPEYKGKKNIQVRIGERFELDFQGTVLVTNRAYRMSGDEPNLSEPVPLVAIYPDDTPRDEATMTMDVLPACLVRNGQAMRSDYTESLISLQKSQCRLASQRDLAVAINEMPVMNVPVSCMNADGTLDLGKMWVSMREYGEDPKESIPINFNTWTGNLENSVEQWRLNNESFYHLTGLCPAIDGLAQGGADSGRALRLGLIKTEARIEAGRDVWTDVYSWLGTAVPQFGADQGITTDGAPIEGVKAEWPTAIPEDPTEQATWSTILFREGGMSRRRLIRVNNPEMNDNATADEEAAIQADDLARRGSQLEDFARMPAV